MKAVPAHALVSLSRPYRISFFLSLVAFCFVFNLLVASVVHGGTGGRPWYPGTVATSAELLADLRLGRGTLTLGAEFTAYNRVTKATETLKFATDVMPGSAPGEWTLGLKVDGFDQGLLASPLIGAEASTGIGVDEMTLKIERVGGMNVGGGFTRPPTINGAVAAGANSMALDGVPQGLKLHRGDLFRVSGGDIDRWYVVMTTVAADSSDEISALSFWPAAPTAGFADNARLIALGHDSLAPLRAYVFKGYDVGGIHYLGETHKGAAVGWANKGSVAAADVLSVTDSRFNGANELVLKLAPAGELGAEPRETYRGYDAAGLFDGTSGSGTATDPWDPEDEAVDSFRLQARVYVPRAWNATTDRAGLVDKTNWGLFMGDFDAGEESFVFKITTGGGTFEAFSPDLPAAERWYWVYGWYNAADNEIYCAWAEETPTETADLSVSSATSTSGTLTAGTDDLVTGANSGKSLFFEGLIHDLSIWTGHDQADADDLVPMISASQAPLIGNEGGLVAYLGQFDFLTDKWLDRGPEFDPNGTSPFDMTLTDGVFPGHSLEGGLALSTDVKPLFVGYGVNQRGEPAASAVDEAAYFSIYDFGPVSRFDEVQDKGEPLTLGTHRTSLLDLFLNDPASGAFDSVVLGDRAFVRTGDLPQGLVTMDGWGKPIPSRTGLKFDGVDDTAHAGTGLNATLGGNQFTIEFSVHPTDPGHLLTNFDLAANSFVEIEIQDLTTGTFERTVTATINTENATTGTTAGFEVSAGFTRLDLERPVKIAVTADFTGDVLDARLYFDAVLVDSISISNRTFVSTPSTANLWIMSRINVDAYSAGVADEFRIWNTVRTLAQIQDKLQELLVPGDHSDLVSYYTVSPYLQEDWAGGDQWLDSKGSNHITIVGAPTWTAGTALASTAPLMQWAIREAMAPTVITFDSSTPIPSDPISVTAGGPLLEDPDGPQLETYSGLLRRIASGSGALVAFDVAGGGWEITRLVDPWSVSADVTITQNELESYEEEPTEEPSEGIAVGFAPVGLVQTGEELSPAVGSGATFGNRRALVGQPMRFEPVLVVEDITAISDVFPASAQALRIPGAWRDRQPARVENQRLATIISREPRFAQAEIVCGLPLAVCGSIIEIRAREVSGGVARGVLVKQRPSLGRGSRLRLWVVPETAEV